MSQSSVLDQVEMTPISFDLDGFFGHFRIHNLSKVIKATKITLEKEEMMTKLERSKYQVILGNGTMMDLEKMAGFHLATFSTDFSDEIKLYLVWPELPEREVLLVPSFFHLLMI